VTVGAGEAAAGVAAGVAATAVVAGIVGVGASWALISCSWARLLALTVPSRRATINLMRVY